MSILFQSLCLEGQIYLQKPIQGVSTKPLEKLVLSAYIAILQVTSVDN